MDTWNNILKEVNLQLITTDNKAECNISVSFMEGEGHWSYVGNESTTFSRNSQSMNLDPSTYNFNNTTALHEFGHAIGLEHDHQHPRRYLVFDEEKLEKDLKGKFDYKTQMLTFEDGDHIGEYDPDSIMHYAIKAEWIDIFKTTKKMYETIEDIKPQQVTEYLKRLTHENKGISEKDVVLVKKLYKDRINNNKTILPIIVTENERPRHPFAVENDSEEIVVEFENKINLYFREIESSIPCEIHLGIKKHTFNLPKGDYEVVFESTSNLLSKGNITFNRN